MHYPRSPREPIDGEVIIKRTGKPTLKSKQGNFSDGGLFIELPAEHDLQKGRRVEVIIVRENGTIRDMQRMSGIVIRIDNEGVAMVTYKADQLRRGEANNASSASIR
ncbi:MAG: PilZ domain-containing protein [Gammaproteobacteria bacterium]